MAGVSKGALMGLWAEQIADVFFAWEPVDVEIGVYANDLPDAGLFGGNYQAGIGKVHWPVAVFLGEFNDPQKVFLLQLE